VGIVRVVVIGFGSVGRSLARVLAYKGEYVRNKFGVDVRVVGVVDSKGMAVKEDGFSGFELLKLASLPRSSVGSFHPYGIPYVDLSLLYERASPDIHVELTPSDYQSGSPGLENVVFALERGAHVVTANKAVLVLGYDRVVGLAKSRGLKLRFSATVMGGSQFLDALLSLKSQDVLLVEGILNATTNYVLTLMEDELLEFEEALRRAQSIGVAEANPELDINGVDAAAKLVILSHVLGKPVSLNAVRRVSLSNVKLRDLMLALKEGYTIRYIARLDLERREASVEPVKVKRDEIIAQVRGVMNVARIKSDVGEYIFIGKGGGGLETAHTVLNDIISLASEVGDAWRR